MKTIPSEILRPDIALTPAALEQKPVLANLLELYSHDFSDFIDLEIGLDGRFGYRDLDLYWTDPDRLPFLVCVANKLAGFVLIKASFRGGGGPARWDMAEFFVLRGYRGRGIGTEAAHQVWRRFPGAWEVRVKASNEPAYRFWLHAVRSFAGNEFGTAPFKQATSDWHRFSFQSGSAGEFGRPGRLAE